MADYYNERAFDLSVLSRLGVRLSQNKFGSNYNPDGKKIRRLSSWAKVRAGGLTLSTRQDTFETTYPGDDKRPTPTLTRLIIRRTGAEAYKFNLSVQIEFEFEVFTKADFELYSSVFLRHKGADDLVVEFGNVETYDGKGKVLHRLDNVQIIPGVWNSTEYNSYICKGKGQSKGDNVAEESLNLTIENAKNITNTNAMGEFTYSVKGYLNKAIAESLSNMGESYTNITPGHGILHSGLLSSTAEGASPKHIGLTYDAGFINMSQGGNAKTILDMLGGTKTDIDTNPYQYINYETILHWINRTLEQREFADTKKILPKVRYTTPAKNKFCYVPSALTAGGMFRSANPWKILWFNGEIGTRGAACYAPDKTDAHGIDFGADIPRANQASTPNQVNSAYRAYSNGDVRFDVTKMWFNVHFIKGLFDRTIRDSYQNTQSGKPGNMQYRTGIHDFMNNLFGEIKHVSGGFIDLTYTSNEVESATVGPRAESGGDADVVILDRNWRIFGESGPPWMLNMRSGDGSTLDFKLLGDLGSLDAAKIYTFSNSGGDKTAMLQQKVSIDTSVYDEKIRSLGVVWNNFGVNGITPNMIAQAASTLKEINALTPYNMTGTTPSSEAAQYSKPDAHFLTADLKMEGIYPLKGGNRFLSDNSPDWFNNAGLCLRVIEVIDQIEAPGDWTTTAHCIMSSL